MEKNARGEIVLSTTATCNKASRCYNECIMTEQNTDTKPEEKDIDADIEERLKGFVDELRPLLGKYELGIAAKAELSPDGRVMAQPIFISTRKMAEEKKAAEAKPAALSEA